MEYTPSGMTRCIVCGRWSFHRVCDRCYAYHASQGMTDDEDIIHMYTLIDRQIEEDMLALNRLLLEERVQNVEDRIA
jgi:hypothetical protein